MIRIPLEGRKAGEGSFALAWVAWQVRDGTYPHIVLALWYSRRLDDDSWHRKNHTIPVDLVTCVT